MTSWIRPLNAALALALLTAAAATPALADDNDADSIKTQMLAGRKLLAEGDDLADEGKTSEALIRYKEGFEKILPSLRQLPFKFEVKRDVTAREELQEFVRHEIETDMTPEEFRASESGMKVLGFIAPDVDLKNLLVNVLAEEIAAFYDPRTDTMHLIKEPEGKNGGRQPSFLQRLMGQTGGFDKDEQKTIIAHEMTHALADQHFDLKTLQEAIDKDDDRQLALSALIEGEATLAMTGAQMEDWTGEMVTKLPAANLGRAFSLMTPFLTFMSGQQLSSAPAIVKESLLFPYLKGLVFCASLANDDKWPGIDAAYKNPPLSTEQILHPEKYRREPDEPRDFDLSQVKTPKNWELLGHNVVGEMQLAVLLRLNRGKQAAAGWDGDRFSVYANPKGRLGLVWRSVWDSEAEATEFVNSYARFQTSKLGEGNEPPDEVQNLLRRDRDGIVYHVEQRGPDVVVVEGFRNNVTNRLVKAAFAVPSFAKTHKTAVATEADKAAAN